MPGEGPVMAAYLVRIAKGENKMEIITTVAGFIKQLETLRLPPDTSIQVTMDGGIQQTKEVEEGVVLPNITPEDQRRLLSGIPKEYQEGGSEELIEIIEKSRINTEPVEL
jgi:hypothetical protein